MASFYKLAIYILATDAFPILAKTGDQCQNVRYPDMKNIGAIHFCQYAFSCATLQNLSQLATNAKSSGNPALQDNRIFALSKLKAFADDTKLNDAQNMNPFPNENNEKFYTPLN